MLQTYSGHRALDPDRRRGLLTCIGALIDGPYDGIDHQDLPARAQDHPVGLSHYAAADRCSARTRHSVHVSTDALDSGVQHWEYLLVSAKRA